MPQARTYVHERSVTGKEAAPNICGTRQKLELLLSTTQHTERNPVLTQNYMDVPEPFLENLG